MRTGRARPTPHLAAGQGPGQGPDPAGPARSPWRRATLRRFISPRRLAFRTRLDAFGTNPQEGRVEQPAGSAGTDAPATPAPALAPAALRGPRAEGARAGGANRGPEPRTPPSQPRHGAGGPSPRSPSASQRSSAAGPLRRALPSSRPGSGSIRPSRRSGGPR